MCLLLIAACSYWTAVRPCSGMAGVSCAVFIVAAALGGGGTAARAQAEGETDAGPNIVFIYVDDMGWKDVGFMGSSFFHTPNIDRLARQGMVFTAAYANAPNCAPSRAALLSGQYAPRTGIYTVSTPARGASRNRKLIPTPNKQRLARDVVTISEVLGDAGYTSASMGKWHLGDPPDYGPEAQGFDLNVGGYGVGNPNPFGAYFSPWSNPYLEAVPSGTYLTEHLTDRALAFMEQNREQPFFLYLPYYTVHSPWQAPDRLVRKYERRQKGAAGKIDPTYGAMVEALDYNVGRLLKKLDALEIADETIFFFTSDNGGHAAVTSMAPLRGSKGMLYEGGIRVPMVVRWPGVTEPGSRSDTPVIGTDLFPTLLEMAGVPAPEGKLLDGQSMVPLLKGRDPAGTRALFWHFPAYLEAYTEEQGVWRTTPAGAVRKGPWKLIEFFEDDRLELYNLEQDLSEQENRAPDRPEKTAQMHRLLREWQQATGAPVPATPNPGYAPAAER